MVFINYPEPKFRMKEENGQRFIFDPIRKIWLLLTEEEWVRQNFVSYLIREMQYPATMIALEKELLLHTLKKRFDVLVYNETFQPWMLVECKAPEIQLSEEVLQQVLRYNITLPVNYLVITNGHQTIAWQKNENGLIELNEMPPWSSANS